MFKMAILPANWT